MKDAYSFDQDEKGMGKSYQAMYDAYIRIYTRAEPEVSCRSRPIRASWGGDVSHEFMAVSPLRRGFRRDLRTSASTPPNKEKGGVPAGERAARRARTRARSW